MRVQTRDQIIHQYNKEFNGHMVFSSNGDSFPADESAGSPHSHQAAAANGPIASIPRRALPMRYGVAARCRKCGSGAKWCGYRGSGLRQRPLSRDVHGNGIPGLGRGLLYMPALYLFGRTPEEWKKAFKGDMDLAPLQVGELPDRV